MESISIHLTKIEELLSQMDEMLDGARAVPFSSKVSIDKSAIFEIIDEMRPIIYEIQKDLPNEIVQARRVINDSNNLVNDARNKAAMIIKAAEAEAEKIVDEHELTRQARAVSQEIMEKSRKEVNDFRLDAANYVDSVFQDTEDIIKDAMDRYAEKSREIDDFYRDALTDLHDNRQKLRATK